MSRPQSVRSRERIAVMSRFNPWLGLVAAVVAGCAPNASPGSSSRDASSAGGASSRPATGGDSGGGVTGGGAGSMNPRGATGGTSSSGGVSGGSGGSGGGNAGLPGTGGTTATSDAGTSGGSGGGGGGSPSATGGAPGPGTGGMSVSGTGGRGGGSPGGGNTGTGGGANPCNLRATVSFQMDVQPFLITTCGNNGGSGCHVVDASATTGTGTGSKNHAYDWITAGAHASSCPETPTPKRFEVVIATIQGANPATCSRSRQMPPPDATGTGKRNPLTACQVAALQAWLREPLVTQMHRADDSSPTTPYPMPPFN